MSKDSSDYYEKIRKINYQNRLLAGSSEQDANPFNEPQKITVEDLKSFLSPENCRAGILLLLWTISPVLIGVVSVQSMLTTFFCIYPLVSPVIWILVGWWKPASLTQSVSLDLVAHVLLFFGIFWILSENWGSSSYYFALDMIGVMVILLLLILSTLGSVIVLFFAAYTAK